MYLGISSINWISRIQYAKFWALKPFTHVTMDTKITVCTAE